MSDSQKVNTIQRKKSRNNTKPKQTKMISKRNRSQPSTSGISKRVVPFHWMLILKARMMVLNLKMMKNAVYELFEPKELKDCHEFIITKWVQCDNELFKHWVHLRFCTPVSMRVIRLGDQFRCS